MQSIWRHRVKWAMYFSPFEITSRFGFVFYGQLAKSFFRLAGILRPLQQVIRLLLIMALVDLAACKSFAI